MRYIPPDLLSKIQSAQQTIYNNTEPKMRIQMSKGFTKELFVVNTIHNKMDLADLDTTLKRSNSITKPSEAYLIYVEDNMIKTAKKDLPYDEMTPWDEKFLVGTGLSVAIEFNGYWERDQETRRFNFVTEDAPWIFWVDQANNLHAQVWSDKNTNIELAENVIKVASIRGWVSSESGPYEDQGLIVAYIKNDGKVFYRNYCKQQDGTLNWEIERRITELPLPARNIALFRTNDFRIGFLAEVDGIIHWTLTTRNYAGMSVWPENITAGLSHFKFEVVPVQYIDTFSAENISTSINAIFLACFPIYPSVISITNSDEFTITIKFSHSITQGLTGLQEAFIVRDSTGTIFNTISTMRGADTTEIVLNVSNFSSARNDMSVTYNNGVTGEGIPGLLTCNNQGCEFDIPSFVQAFKADIAPPEGHTSEIILVGVLPTFVVSQVTYRDAFHRGNNHNISAGLSYAFLVTKVGHNPL